VTYDYKCDKCNTTHSVERSMAEQEVLPICTSCQNNMTRVWSAVPVKFNADGFYSTGG
jgi:putative FmdB family regulatory protein